MSKKDEEAMDFAKMLRYTAECIECYQRMKSLHNCNDCGIKDSCKFVPKFGETVRFNCPLWRKGK